MVLIVEEYLFELDIFDKTRSDTLERTLTIKLYEEEFYQKKGPRGLPSGYWYRFRLDNE